MARARDPDGAPEPQDTDATTASAASPDDARTSAAKPKRQTSVAKKADATDSSSKARSRSRSSRGAAGDETTSAIESETTARGSSTRRKKAAGERSSKTTREKKTVDNEGPIEIIKRAYDLGLDSTTSDRRAAARRRYGLAAATLETPASAPPSPEPKRFRTRSAKKETKPSAEALRPEDTALTETPESAELSTNMVDVENDAALHVTKARTHEETAVRGRDEVDRPDDALVEETKDIESEIIDSEADAFEATDEDDDPKHEPVAVDDAPEEPVAVDDALEAPVSEAPVSEAPVSEAPVLKVEDAEDKPPTKKPRKRKPARVKPTAKMEPEQDEVPPNLVDAVIIEAEPVVIEAEPVIAVPRIESAARDVTPRRSRLLRIVGLLVIGAALVVAGVIAIVQSPEDDGAPGASTTSSSTFPRETSSTTIPTAPGATEAIRLSGDQPRQSALFRLPGGTVRISYTSTGGELTVRVLRQASTGSGEVFTCSATCDRSATVSEDAGMYYLDVESRDSEWMVRVEY